MTDAAARADVSAAILAGGASTRMGHDKAHLPYRGSTLLQHVVDAARGVTETILVVGGASEVPTGCAWIADQYPGEGPLGGVVTALAHVRTSWCLVLACDTPLLCPRLLEGLVRTARAAPQADLVVPRVRGHLEPLVAVYRTGLRARLEVLFRSGERALHRACRSPATLEVDEGILRAWDEGLASFENANSPEDVARLELPWVRGPWGLG